jgi:bifunctional enzyme CysN/CysC
MHAGAPAAVHAFFEQSATKDLLRFSTMGSVDDGKSTLIGRLLYDAHCVYEDHLRALQADSVRVGTGPAVDFALLTDGLKAEREQKITIDVAYRYFSTPKRHFIIADTPGHEEYTRNMATGSSTANLAIILIDARHGILTQTKRHSFIASLLGIPRVLVAVNKMDLVSYSQAVFDRIVADYREFATRLGILDVKFVPISALKGDNVVQRSPNMPWYRGDAILEYLEGVYIGSDRNLIDFRLPVQYVVRPNADFRGFSGQIASGVVKVGDDVLVLPSMKTSRIKSLFVFGDAQDYAFSPMSVTVTLEDEVDISRGDMLVHPKNLPRIQSTFEGMVVWMAHEPMRPERTYLVKHTTRTTRASIAKIEYRVDVNTLSRLPPAPLGLNEIGRVVFQATRNLFLDSYLQNRLTGSFIIIDPDSNNTLGAGMVIDRIPGGHLRAPLAEAPRSQNVRREEGYITAHDRERLLGQRAVTIWLTGLSSSGKSSIAKETERRLHAAGRHVCILDGDNLRLGLNRDLSFSSADRTENIRRAAEVAHLLNDAGIIVLVPVISPYQKDRANARRVIGEARFYEVHVSTPLEVCEMRDAKGLYRKARAGELEEFTGISAPYEPPESPFLRLDTTARTIEECAEELVARVSPSILEDSRDTH